LQAIFEKEVKVPLKLLDLLTLLPDSAAMVGQSDF
jgi:hypothetical protein